MFNKFKNRLSENSSLSLTPSILNLSQTNKKNITGKTDLVGSDVSEDNQSSDDNTCQNSKQNIIKSNNQILSPNTDNESVSESTELGENNLFFTNKIQLQELNRSLLKEIDKLHVIFFKI